MAKARAAAIKPAPTLKKSFWASDRNIAVALGAFAFVLYAQTIGFGYALDDVAVLHGNKFVKDGFGGFDDILTTFYWHGNASFENSNSGLFRPLSLLLFATEWQIFGDKPGVFHFVHVVLYALVSAQLYLLLQSLFGKENGRLALVSVLLWIILPIHTEVVANLKSADEILALLFSVFGLRWLLKWSDNQKMSVLFVSAGFFFLSLLAKEAAVLILPLALLMLMMFRGKTIKDLLLPGAVLFLFSVIWLGWHYAVISGATSERVTYDYRHNALLSSASGIDQLGTAMGLQARYWLKMLVGYPLSYNYSFNEIPVEGFAGIWPWITVAGVGAAGYFAWKNFRTNPVISFAIIFYFVTMLLTSNIFYKIGDIFAERFTFVPSVAFCILLAYAVMKFTNSKAALTSTAIGIIVMLCIIYSARTYARTSDWKTEEQLFLTDVDNAPNSARVHDNAGVIWINRALQDTLESRRKTSFDEAYSEFYRAYEIDARDFSAAQALGQISYHRGDYQGCVTWSHTSIAQRRSLSAVLNDEVVDDPTTFMNMGDAFIKLERFDSAGYYYNAAVELFPTAEAHMKIGDAFLRAKDTTAALQAYQRAVEIDSAFIVCWDKIANLNGMLGNMEASNAAFLKMAGLRPEDPNPWRMMYTNYSMMGDSVKMKEAAAEYYKRGGK